MLSTFSSPEEVSIGAGSSKVVLGRPEAPEAVICSSFLTIPGLPSRVVLSTCGCYLVGL